MRANSFVNFRRISLDPPPDGRMVYRQSSLTHHLFKITIGELKSAIPSDTQENDGRLVMTPLKRGFILFQDDDSRREMKELEDDYSQGRNSCNTAAFPTVATQP
jgi:hypothetical protein